jgi:hypothetical protein
MLSGTLWSGASDIGFHVDGKTQLALDSHSPPHFDHSVIVFTTIRGVDHSVNHARERIDNEIRPRFRDERRAKYKGG